MAEEIIVELENIRRITVFDVVYLPSIATFLGYIYTVYFLSYTAHFDQDEKEELSKQCRILLTRLSNSVEGSVYQKDIVSTCDILILGFKLVGDAL